MGNKITIDSATLMNKGFEVIEAHYLYNIPYEKIEVIMHPQSIIHSLVEFKDNSVLAQLGNPDMKIPIQYALSYPKRFSSDSKKLDLLEIKNLTFKKPDFELLKKINARGVMVTAISNSGECDFVSRFFAPGHGINEDPVTGSAHCCLGPYWQKRLNKDVFTAYQASDRGGLVKVRVGDGRVYLSGQAVTVFCAELKT